MPINQSDRPRGHSVLDPCLLGRPVHLLPGFAARLAEAIGGEMASPAGRRYWGAYRLEQLAFERAPEAPALRWLGVAGPFGVAAVAFERTLLLGLLEGRYARRQPGVPAAVQQSPILERVTATEERLAAALAQQLASLLDGRVAEGLARLDGAAQRPVLAKAGAVATPAIVPASAPGKTGWVIRAVLRAQYGRRADDEIGEPAGAALEGQIWISLDHALMACILQGLKAERGAVRAAGGARMTREPLASRLEVKLEGRLVSKEVTLAALFGLQVGDVIPVAVGRADVLLDDSRLFTASVAEHKGKLCLTSFEDAE
ncbi:FliM/FliN family flagellar motor C-terminal domain-containing protein [Massilia aurea]|uniref:FliM/FliN family flagellar motor switch protein n=1 Tax=Massilia aurea TaxID=373040 RepID=UPI0034636673